MLPILTVIMMTMMTGWGTLNASLTVYRLSGNVIVKNAAGETALRRRAVVAPADNLVIPADGKVEIYDSGSGRIYSSLSSGTISVKQLIADAKADASSVTHKTNARLLATINENALQQTTRYGRSGVSRHATDAASSGLFALPDGITPLGYLMGLQVCDDYDNSHDIVLIRREYGDGDDTFCFVIFNTIDQPLYVNILEQRPDGEINAYFDRNPLVGPRGATMIQHYRYMLTHDTGYIVVASDHDFTAAELELLLDSGYTPEHNFYYSLLCP